MDATVLLRRGDKIITGGREWEGLERKRKGGKSKRKTGLGVGGDRGDVQRVRKLNRAV